LQLLLPSSKLNNDPKKRVGKTLIFTTKVFFLALFEVKIALKKFKKEKKTGIVISGGYYKFYIGTRNTKSKALGISFTIHSDTGT
jgi:hypothetical protein